MRKVHVKRGMSTQDARKHMSSAIHYAWKKTDNNSKHPDFDRHVSDYLKSQNHHVKKNGDVVLNPKWLGSKRSVAKFKKKAIKKYGENMEEDAPTNSVAHGGVDLAPHARKAFKPINVTDRRSKKRTVLLKRFRDYIHQQNG